MITSRPALLLAVLLAGCSGRDATPPPPAAGLFGARLHGTLTLADGEPLPAGAMVDVQLVDPDATDSAALVVAHEHLHRPPQPPVPFLLRFKPAAIDSGRRYLVTARVTVEDVPRWITTDTVWVLTRGAPRDSVVIRLSRTGAPR